MKLTQFTLIITIILAIIFIVINVILGIQPTLKSIISFEQAEISKIKNNQLIVLAPDLANQRLTDVYTVNISKDTKIIKTLYQEKQNEPLKLINATDLTLKDLKKGEKIKLKGFFVSKDKNEIIASIIEVTEIMPASPLLELPSFYQKPQESKPKTPPMF